MITKDNNLKVMSLFFKQPHASFHIRQIARLTKLSSTGVIKIVKRLKAGGLLVSKKINMIEEVKPNFEGKFLPLKRLYNIFSITESGLTEYLKKFYEFPSAIILFGSYSNGADAEKSDIDIAIISNKKELPDVSKFEKLLARKISLHVTNLSTASKEFKNSLANGIILDGVVELIK